MSDEHDSDSEEPSGGPVGSVAGGASEILEGVAGALGEDEEDAKAGLEVAGAVATGVQQGARVVDAAQQGNVGAALGAAGEGVGALVGGASNLVPSEAREGVQEAAGAARTVGQAAQGVSRFIEDAGDFLEQMSGGERHDVLYHLEVQGSEELWSVHYVSLSERLGELSSGVIEASIPGDSHPEESEFLGKDVGLIIERGEQRRSFRGIARHASVRFEDDRCWVHFDLAPALWLASETLDSRIYQDIDVPALVKQIVTELIGDRQRTVRLELTEDYTAHEYLVQHRESYWTFIKRICEEEGIYLLFDHDEEDREVLVLADSNDNRPLARPDEDGVVPYEANANQAEGREVATSVSRHHRVSATDVTVRGYDWTNPALEVHQEQVDRGTWEGPRLEHYHHDHAVRHHEYDEGGGSYQSHTAERVARMHTERLDVQRNLLTVSTTVISAMPGHIFELQGHDEHDGRYLIVRATASGRAGAHSGGEGGHGGSFENTLTCIPADMPYRPPQPERRRMPGPETAVIVGPAGEEIHTDKHGRVKVQFMWDRQGQRDERSSVWIRVNYNWAGPGWGQIFIPRIGMEVTVSFLGGDPDRPVVTGCLFNGENLPPYPLPDEKTKSTIKTNSSPGGGGYNELRFEDKAGSEEIFTHAQKDYNEVVEHCHTTHVKVDQSNTVDNDQTETVGNDQTMHVKHDRTKNVDNDEKTEIGGNRTEEVTGHEQIHIHDFRKVKIEADEKLVVHGNRTMKVDGRDDEEVVGGRDVTIAEFDNLNVIAGANRNVTVAGQYNVKVDGEHYTLLQGDTEKLTQGSGKTYVESANEVHVKTGSSDLLMKKGGVIQMTGESKIELTVGGCKIEMTQQTITLSAGASSIELGPSGVTTSGPKVTSSADTMNEITGLLVKIN